MGKTIVVTGASRGIGLAITTYLLKNGHNVIAIARSESVLFDLQRQYSKQMTPLIGDVSESNDVVDRLANLCFEKQLDGLIINHGTLEPAARVASGNIGDWKKCFDVNFFSAINLVAIPALRFSKGRIVLVSSGAARHSYTGWGAYCASKAALKSLGDTLATEEPGIITMSVEPGTVDTGMQKDIREKHSSVMDEKDNQRFASLYSDGKLVQPEEPGRLMAKLVLDASVELSGKTFRWDSDIAAPYRDQDWVDSAPRA